MEKAALQAKTLQIFNDEKVEKWGSRQKFYNLHCHLVGPVTLLIFVGTPSLIVIPLGNWEQNDTPPL